MSLWERMFATNIFGPVALTKALLPSMRKAGRGRIVLVSSAGGVRGMPATAPYSAVKGALERWGESMAGEVAPFGIGVTILVTGTYDTEIITDAGTTDNRDLDGPYARHHRTMDKRGRAMMKRAAKSPDRFAVGLAKALEGSAPFVRRPVGPDARMLLIADRLLPDAAMHHMTRLMMGIPRFGALRRHPGRNHGSTRPADAGEREPWLTFGSRSKMMIDGKLVDGEAGTFTNINPATEEALGEVADASKEDMHRAIDAARRAFDETDWSTNHSLRQRCLLQLHDAIEAEKEELREELILEVGCPRAVTHGAQLDAPLEDGLRYPARLIDEYPWETSLGDMMVSLTGVNTTRTVWREPVGVVGAIVPWNFPFEVSIQKIGQALATGNTMVLKPAPNTPYNANRLGRLIAENTDIPPGVINVVTASDHFVGEELTLSPKVDLISFTGSTVVGKRIMEKGAATMKRLFLELGGKSATIVLEDADFALGCMMGIAPCMHAGQGCAMPTRMLLPRSRYDEGVEILKGIYEGIAPGDPQDPATLCGPVISDRQRSRIRGYIEKGVEEGARMLVGGAEAPDGLDKGFLVKPTLFVDVDNSMTIAQEEIFGPVLVVIPFDDEDDAVRIANDSPYGLAGNVMAGTLEHALAVAKRLRAGFIGVNGTAGYGADTPFGGYKASGIGRQNGIAGFDQYTEVKSVAYPPRLDRSQPCQIYSTISRTSGPLTMPSPVTYGIRIPSWLGFVGRSRSSGSTCRRCPAKRASPSSSCTATKTPSRCCATTSRSRRRASSRPSVRSSASA